LFGNAGSGCGESKGDALLEDGSDGSELWTEVRFAMTGASMMVPLFVYLCDFGRDGGSRFTFPWLSCGLTAVTEVRGEIMPELPTLVVLCCGDLIGDRALGGFLLPLGTLFTGATTEPGDFFTDGPIFAGGCRPGVPLA
jgi:hypothetical protein